MTIDRKQAVRDILESEVNRIKLLADIHDLLINQERIEGMISLREVLNHNSPSIPEIGESSTFFYEGHTYEITRDRENHISVMTGVYSIGHSHYMPYRNDAEIISTIWRCVSSIVQNMEGN